MTNILTKIPKDEDFELVAIGKFKNDLNYATDNFTLINDQDKLWRRFVAGILLDWKILVDTLYKILVNTNGVSSTDIKEILTAVKSCQDPHYIQNYNHYKNISDEELEKLADPNQLTGSNLENLADAISAKLTGNIGNILINTSAANQDFCRLIIYDTRYGGSGARRHIFFKKKNMNNIYTMTFGGSELGPSHDWFDEPLFSSVQMALDFIKNLDRIQTKYDISKFNIRIVNSSIDPGWPHRGQLIQDLSNSVKVNTICGEAYIQRSSRACMESLEENDMNEAIEKHETLNPKIFENNKVKPEVRQKVQDVVNEYLKLLYEEDVKLKVQDVILAGSNASFNYTDNSDLDIHILANVDDTNDPDDLYSKIYNAYRRIFESKFDITFYGIPVEIYVELTKNANLISNGIYSVMFDEWVKEPKESYVPEIDQAAIDKAAEPWIKEAEELVKLANDNVPDGDEEIDNYINRIYEMRQQGLHNSEGSEFSTENLVFKEVRNAGLLDRLKNLKNIIISKKLSLEEAMGYLDDAKEFKDYGTSDVEGGDVIDTTKASTFSTQDLLDHKEDKAYDGIVYDIVDLTPIQYFELCGKVQKMDPQEMMQYIRSDERQLAHIKDVILKYNKRLQMPYVSFSKMDEVSGQEGRHRMYALGELYGWDKEFPVMVIQDLGAKKSISELLSESLNENMSEQDRRDIYNKISQLTHYQPIVHNDGKFEIHLVKEDDIWFVLSILRRQNWVIDCHSVPGKFDFSNVSSFNLPSRYHTVIGRVVMHTEEFELER